MAVVCRYLCVEWSGFGEDWWRELENSDTVMTEIVAEAAAAAVAGGALIGVDAVDGC